jgi:hypothetical protein
MPVHRDTTSATSSSVTLLRSSVRSVALRRLRLLQLLLELRQAAVLQLGHARQIAGAARRLELELDLLDLALDRRSALQGGLLRFPDLLEVRELALDRLDLLVQQRQLLRRRLVLVLLHRLALDLELDQAPFEAIHGLGLGIDLHADAARRPRR